MTLVHNRGVTMTKGGTSVGNIVDIDPPTIETTSIPVTLQSDTKKGRIPSTLLDWKEFTLTIMDEGTAYADVIADIVAGSVELCVLTTPANTYTFSGWFLSADANESQGEEDDVSKFEVTVDLDPRTMVVS